MARRLGSLGTHTQENRVLNSSSRYVLYPYRLMRGQMISDSVSLGHTARVGDCRKQAGSRVCYPRREALPQCPDVYDWLDFNGCPMDANQEVWKSKGSESVHEGLSGVVVPSCFPANIEPHQANGMQLS